jgi:hypothetical protein
MELLGILKLENKNIRNTTAKAMAMSSSVSMLRNDLRMILS